MHRTKWLIIMLVVSIISAGNLSGADYATVDEATAMLSRAITAMKTDKAEAISAFNFNKPQFRDRDLYVFCFNVGDGKFTADEARVSMDVRLLRDKTGKMFGEQMYKTAEEGRIAEVDYMSPIPGSTEQVPKSAYITRIADQVCGVSVYRPNKSASHSPTN